VGKLWPVSSVVCLYGQQMFYRSFMLWSQAFLNKDYLHTYKYREENVLNMTLVRFRGRFVTFFVHQTIQLCDYILLCVCENNLLLVLLKAAH